MCNPIRLISNIFASLLILLALCPVSWAGEGIPRARLDTTDMSPELAYAQKLWLENNTEEAIREIEKQIGQDSSLVPQAAIILGGNYHLVRLTNNVFADRVGGFSPSGDKLVYTRDTSLTRFDDGLFDRYEDRVTGIAYYDFIAGTEIVPEIPSRNAFMPRFYSDSSFLYLIGNDGDSGDYAGNLLYLYNILSGTSTECYPLTGQYYCPYEMGIIYYDNNDGAFILKSLNETSQKVLFDNDSIFSLRRPLTIVQNLSCGNSIILFQAGHASSREITDIYGLSPKGGKPKKMTDRYADWYSNPIFYPAAANECEFAYLENAEGEVDIYYQAQAANYRLTYDGGDKYYLAISPDGLKVAYSYLPPGQGAENYEVFILDFSLDAPINDIKYRIKECR